MLPIHLSILQRDQMKIIWLCNLHNTSHIKVLRFYAQSLKRPYLYVFWITLMKQIENGRNAHFREKTDYKHYRSGHENTAHNRNTGLLRVEIEH